MTGGEMSDQLERELVRTLDGAAASAPTPDGEFLAGVRGRQQRRRRRRTAVAAACGVALTVVASLTVVRLGAPPPTLTDPAPAVAAWSGTVPAFTTALESPERVWPEAVRRLPGTLPDGREYGVLAILDDDRYLVESPRWGARSIPENQLASYVSPQAPPSVFDVRAGTVRALGDPTAAAGKTRYGVPDFAVLGDELLWWATYIRGDIFVRELWSARLDGTAAPRLLHTPAPADRALPTLGVAGDHVYWYQEGAPAGIYRLSAAGGTPTPVPGAEGFYPAVSGPGHDGLSPWVDNADVPSPTSGELWNLVTGQRLRWTTQPSANVSCDPVLCSGQTRDGQPFVQRLDGSGYQLLPYRGSFNFQMYPAVDGRFGVGAVRVDGGPAPFVWDRSTGRTALITTVPPNPITTVSPGGAKPARDAPATLLGRALLGADAATVQWWDGAGGFYLLDLRAIG
ncbi:hypothetical protein I0C86_18315 [Plantactinospora sp. S1510]|uniref:Uncharacterized protein n=1 Tax=Plantactinospora alkalitolerans TaxID=2789879 RepID=A0ABS0GXG3_9ACTN|nr:hypothetical protein [Plantactinospora alkalitolerans]MBF9130897.1 hypothetical protein [Plantactinospora alkalitolerans]